MKNTIVNFALFIAIVVLLSSCSKVLEPANGDNTNRDIDGNVLKTITSSISSTDDDLGTLEARCIKVHTGSSNGFYSVSAYIQKDQNHYEWVNVGKVTVADYTINSPDSTNYYSHEFSPSNYPSFGTTREFAIEGNPSLNIPAFDTTLYIPKELSITNTFPNDELHNNQALTLQWNQDTQNDFCYLAINYDVLTSNDDDSSLPDSTIFWSVKIPDNGTYTIPTSVLQQFPVGATIDFFLVRGNALIVNKNGKKYTVLADDVVMLLLNVVN